MVRSRPKLDDAPQRHVTPTEPAEIRLREAPDSRPWRPKKLRKMSPQNGIVYGPVRSRRLGVSLGINLLPTRYKLCSFNCVFCQHGWTKKGPFVPTEELIDLPGLDAIVASIEAALSQLTTAGKNIDSLTICGNGEPTLYPDLATVVQIAKQARDRYQPQARLAILSNSSTIGSQTVRAALEPIDLKIMKFDAGSEEMFCQLNHPRTPIYMGDIVAGLKQLKNITLQSLFVQGRVAN